MKPKVAADYAEEVKQGEQAQEAYTKALEDAQAAVAAAAKAKPKKGKKAKKKAAELAANQAAAALAALESEGPPEVPRIDIASFGATMFGAALKQDQWVSIGDFHRYFDITNISFVTERLSSVHQYGAHWEWADHTADNLDANGPDEALNAAIRNVQPQTTVGSLAAQRFWVPEHALLRCDGGAHGSWVVIQVSADPVTADSAGRSNTLVTVTSTTFDESAGARKKRLANHRPPALTSAVATVSCAPGKVPDAVSGCQRGPTLTMSLSILQLAIHLTFKQLPTQSSVI